MDSTTKTIQFLMGLNEVFDAVKNQLLMQEPLPTVNRAYAIMQTVESQKLVHKNFEETVETSAMMVKLQNSGKVPNSRSFSKKREGERKDDRICEYCKA